MHPAEKMNSLRESVLQAFPGSVAKGETCGKI